MLYHGSRVSVPKLERRQPVTRDGQPKKGSFFAVYATPDFGTALAIGGRPDGLTVTDEEKRTLKFEDPNLFNPDMEVYIYFIDISEIPEEKIVRINEFQVAVLDEVVPAKVEKHKAGEVLNYYSIIGE